MAKIEHSSGFSDEASDDGEELRMPPPPLDWELNCLLTHLNQEMTKDDLDSAKALFQGMDGFGRNLLAEIETPLRLFDAMQKRTFLDRNNILFLQAMLHKIGRMDLFDSAIKYAHKIGDTIHFSKPPSEPANGYQFVKFHVEGTNFTKYKRSSLETLRATAAVLMGVPSQFVTIAGIEPSTSLLVTLMVPSKFVAYLEMAMTKEDPIATFTNLGVDMVSINDKIYNLHGVEDAELIETESQIKLKSIYEKLTESQENLEAREIECIQLYKIIEEHERTRLKNNERMKAVLVRILNENHIKQSIPKLSRQSAFVIYKYCLNQTRTLGYNTAVIESLMDAYSLVLSARVNEIREYRVNALLVENDFLKSEISLLTAKNTRLLTLHSLNNIDLKVLKRLVDESMPCNDVELTFRVQFNQQDFQILKTISDLLNTKEKEQLLKAYRWPKDDPLTQNLEKRESVFLANLMVKEFQITNRPVDFETFVLKKLSDVNRPDLQDTFLKIVASRAGLFNPTPQAAGSKPKQSGAKKFPKYKATKRQQSRSRYQSMQENKKQDNQMEVLLKKVENIEGMMQEARRPYKSMFGPEPFKPYGFHLGNSTILGDSLSSLKCKPHFTSGLYQNGNAQ